MFTITYRTRPGTLVTIGCTTMGETRAAARSLVRNGCIVKGWTHNEINGRLRKFLGLSDLWLDAPRVSNSPTEGTQYLTEPERLFVQDFAWVDRKPARNNPLGLNPFCLICKADDVHSNQCGCICHVR